MIKKTFMMPVFIPRKVVWFDDGHYLIEHVVFSQGKILLKLEGRFDLVDSDKVYCEPSMFEYKSKS